MTSRLIGLAAFGIVGSLAGLSGCSHYQLADAGAAPIDLSSPPPAGQAKICVVRPQSRILSFTGIVHDNGNLVGATRGQSYFCYLAEPGNHLISTTSERDTADAEANLQPGKSYYLEQYIDNGYQHMNIVLDWISQGDATAEARGLRYLALSAAPRNEVLPQIGAVVPAQREDTATMRSALPPASHGG